MSEIIMHGMRPDATLAEREHSLCLLIDQEAEAHRLRHKTPGLMQAHVYAEKAVEAQEIDRVGPEKADALTEAEREAMFPAVSASVGIEAPTLSACAALVLKRYAVDALRNGAIERTRLAAKKAVRAATTPDAALAAYKAVKWPA